MEEKLANIKIPVKNLKVFEQIESYNGWPKSYLIQQALDLGLKRLRKDLAVELYEDSKVDLGRAACLAELSVWEMVELLKKRGVTSGITGEDLELATKIL